MNAFTRVDKQTFLSFAAEHAEHRYEYVRGRIVQQMTGGTREHGGVSRRITRQLEDQLDESLWWTLNDRGVETLETIRYPDVVVEPSDEPVGSLCTRRAVVIVEVPSLSTGATDLDVKPAEYLSLDTLDAYIIASQDEAAMLVYERQADGHFPSEPREVAGRGAQSDVNGRSVRFTLSLDVVYRGIA